MSAPFPPPLSTAQSASPSRKDSAQVYAQDVITRSALHITELGGRSLQGPNSHPLVRQDPICPAGLEAALNVSLAVDLDAAKDVFRPGQAHDVSHADSHSQEIRTIFPTYKGYVRDGHEGEDCPTHHAILPKSGGFRLCQTTRTLANQTDMQNKTNSQTTNQRTPRQQTWTQT